MEAIKQGLLSVKRINEILSEKLENSEQTDLSVISELLLAINALEPSLVQSEEILRNSISEEAVAREIDDLSPMTEEELLEYINELDMKLKHSQSQLKQQETTINYLQEVSESKGALINKINFKYHKASSELRLTKSEFEHLLYEKEELGKENNKLKSEILSIRSSLTYYDPIKVESQDKQEEEIFRLRRQIEKERNRNTQSLEKVHAELHHKNIYIDKLVSQIEKMHQVSNFNKENVNELKGILDQTMGELSDEKLKRAKQQKDLLVSQSAAALYKRTLDQTKIELKDYKLDSEQKHHQFAYELEQKYKRRTQKMRAAHEEELKNNQKAFFEKIHILQKQFSKNVEPLNQYWLSKCQDIRNSYQERIHSIVQEFSQQEALFFKKLHDLALHSEHNQLLIQQLNNELSRIHVENKVNSEEIKDNDLKIKELNMIAVSCKVNLKAKIAECNAQYQLIHQHVSDFKNEIHSHFQHENQVLMNTSQEKIDIIQKKRTEERLRMKIKIEEQSKKALNLRAVEKQTYIEEIGKIEKLRLDQLEFTKEHIVEIEKENAKKLEDLIAQFETEKETLMLKSEDEKKDIVKQHQREMKDLTKQKHLEKYESLRNAEENYVNSLKEIKLKYKDKLKNMQERWVFERNELTDKFKKQIEKAEEDLRQSRKLMVNSQNHYKGQIKMLEITIDANVDRNNKLKSKCKSLEAIKKNLENDLLQAKIRLEGVIKSRELEKEEIIQQLKTKYKSKIENIVKTLNEEFKNKQQEIINRLKDKKNKWKKAILKYQEKIKQQNAVLESSVDQTPVILQLKEELTEKSKQILSMNKSISTLRSHIKNLDESKRLFPSDKAFKKGLNTSALLQNRGISPIPGRRSRN